MTPENLVRIGVCVTPDIRARLDRAAADEDMPLSLFVRRMIGRYLVALDELEAEEAEAAKVAA